MIVIDGSTGTKKVGILTAAPDQALTVVGTASKTAAGGFIAISDERLKKDIVDWKVGLSSIERLQCRRWKFRPESEVKGDDLEKTYYGFIAQEIERVIPECVERMKSRGYDDCRVLDITNVTYALVNAVKELSERVKDLEKKIDRNV